MRSILVALVLFGSLFGAASLAHAERTTLGPHLGLNFDYNDPLIGLEGRIDLANLTRTVILQIDPMFSYYFTDNIDVFNFSLNMPFEFEITGSVLRPFIAPGLAVIHVSADAGGSDTDAALALLFGLLFRLDAVDPFVELRVLIGDNSMAELIGGVLFRL